MTEIKKGKGSIIKLTSFWRKESEKSVGGEYFVGRMGAACVLLFHNRSTHPKAPDFDLCVSPFAKRDRQPQSYAVKSPPTTDEEMPDVEFNEDTEDTGFPEEPPPDEGEVDEDPPF